ncbi:MAG: tetratricopeptide repeat protein [Candidatus Entotheonellia bacterium]
MVSVILLVVMIVVAGGVVWMRRRRGQARTNQLPPEGIPRETLALDAFTHGNSCLAEGKFADAIAAFQRSRELDPKRPHVADRLAEVERQQHAASAMPPASSSS